MNFIVGIIIGALSVCAVWVALDVERKCMTQSVRVIKGAVSPYINIGEVVVCAENWEISNIYGPEAKNFYGKIELRDWDSEEFIGEDR